MSQIGWLLGFLDASFSVAALGGLATSRSATTWYRRPRKPSWNPPDWVFGPVTSFLYLAMSVSACVVRRDKGRGWPRAGAGMSALAAWAVQLALNLLLSVVYFGPRGVGGALVVIGPLWAAIAATAVHSARVARTAGGLLLPYVAWTSSAVALNARVWRLNRGR